MDSKPQGGIMGSYELDISFLSRHDQGDRGTCMAVAITSLLEYYHHDGVRLSPQYLYAWCKHEDQGSQDGTDIETAFRMAKVHGACKESVWPYNKNAAPDTVEDDVEAQMQITVEKLRTLETISCWNIPFQLLCTPYSVEECKAALRGDGGYRPMPVVIGCTVFTSFMQNLQRDGWIHLPQKGEASAGGHAMLITGYQDTPGFFHEGYFWALNSWGGSVHDDQKHVGMVKIPYEYYKDHAMVAGTIREAKNTQDGQDDGKEQTLQDCGETADHAASGAVNSSKEAEPNGSKTSSVGWADGFFTSLERNLNQSFFPFPYELFQERRPLVFRKQVQLEKTRDETGHFMAFINGNANGSHLHEGCVKVFSLCREGTCRVIAAVLSHADGTPVGMEDIILLRDFIRDRLPLSISSVHDTVVISASAFDDDCQAALSPTTFLCSPADCGMWDVQFPTVHFSEDSIRFLLHALPCASDVHAERLADLIAHWPKDQYITKEALRTRLRLHSSLPDAFLNHWLNTLFSRGGYAKDNRGYIYPPGATLPDGCRARRTNRFK